jgi:hypothetical protein
VTVTVCTLFGVRSHIHPRPEEADVSEQVEGVLRDPELTWVAIQEAALGHRSVELADIAIGLYGQLGEARAEIDRLRVTLRTSLAALTPHAPAD